MAKTPTTIPAVTEDKDMIDLGSSASVVEKTDLQEPANDPLTVSDDQPRETIDPHFGKGGSYKIDEATGKRVPA